jgi:hypothetical protein
VFAREVRVGGEFVVGVCREVCLQRCGLLRFGVGESEGSEEGRSNGLGVIGIFGSSGFTVEGGVLGGRTLQLDQRLYYPRSPARSRVRYFILLYIYVCLNFTFRSSRTVTCSQE